MSMNDVAVSSCFDHLLTKFVPFLVQAQMQEMEMVRQKVFDLERNHQLIKQRYFSLSWLV